MNRLFIRFLITLLFFSQFSALSYAEMDVSEQPNAQEMEALRAIRGKVKGQIVFQRRLPTLWSIWKMNADGTDLKMISDGNSDDQYPIWSHDGKKIFFLSNRSGHWQIHSMDENGGNIENLSQTNKREHLCNFSVNDAKMLFQTEEDGSMKAFVREMSSRKVYEIDFSEFPGKEGKLFPMLSPDGKRIALLFKGGTGAGRSVYVGDLDESYKVKNIVKIHLGCFSVWARDSFRFLMCIFVKGGTALHLVTADATEKNPVTEGGRWNYFPAWSPDEEWIVWAASPTEYHDYNSGRYDLYIASLKDRKPIRLTFNIASDIYPSWKP
jgi:TolB protein